MTDDGARAIAIRLDAGQELSDHQVRERAWVVVVEGDAEISCGNDVVRGGVGTLATFDSGRASCRLERDRRPRAFFFSRRGPETAITSRARRRADAGGGRSRARLRVRSRAWRFSCERQTRRSMK